MKDRDDQITQQENRRIFQFHVGLNVDYEPLSVQIIVESREVILSWIGIFFTAKRGAITFSFAIDS